MNNTIIIYSLLSFLILFLCGKVSYKLNLLDHPNKRKVHSKATAYTGGFAISVILLFSIFLFTVSDKNLNIILSIAFLISIFLIFSLINEFFEISNFVSFFILLNSLLIAA